MQQLCPEDLLDDQVKVGLLIRLFMGPTAKWATLYLLHHGGCVSNHGGLLVLTIILLLPARHTPLPAIPRNGLANPLCPLHLLLTK